MKKIIIQVSGIKEFEDGYTCSLTRNGRKVAFIAPGIFEWNSNSAMMEVCEYFAHSHGLKVESPEPVELTENWQPDKTDLERHEQRFDSAQQKLKEWVDCHFTAYRYAKQAKKTIVTINPATKTVLDWRISHKEVMGESLSAQLSAGALKRVDLMSVSELANLLFA